jgi:hypothetical protein
MEKDQRTDSEYAARVNDYTLRVTTDFGRQTSADPELTRIFNFRARSITHIFSQWGTQAVGNSMLIERFSDLDSLDEVALMHAKLVELGGKPPALDDITRRMRKAHIQPVGRCP